MYDHKEFLRKLDEYLEQDTGRNGVPWPANPLEKYILGWLEIKSDHDYTWPRWPAAEEAAEAARTYVTRLMSQAPGDIDYVYWALNKYR